MIEFDVRDSYEWHENVVHEFLIKLDTRSPFYTKFYYAYIRSDPITVRSYSGKELVCSVTNVSGISSDKGPEHKVVAAFHLRCLNPHAG